MHQRISWLFLWAVVAAVSLRAQAPAPAAGAQAAAMPPGTVLVAKVNGSASMIVNGTTTQLSPNVSVPQTAKITTLANSSVTLVFSNGATTQLGANTELVLEEFLQDPFAGEVKPSQMTEEPTSSVTKLSLNRGELVGDVKHLHRDKGSSFTVQTPVGAAGIRGTIFKITFFPSGNGQAFFQLTTAVGEVAFAQPTVNGAGTVTSPTTPTDTGVGVPQGQAISITVDVTTNAQGVMVANVISTQSAVPINATTTNMQAITAAAQDIAVAVQQTTFTAPPAGTPAGTAPTGTTTTTTKTTTDTSTTTSTSTTTTTDTGTTTTSTTSSQNKVTGQSFTVDTTATTPVTPPRLVENPGGGAGG